MGAARASETSRATARTDEHAAEMPRIIPTPRPKFVVMCGAKVGFNLWRRLEVA